jgi:hypothetical protein
LLWRKTGWRNELQVKIRNDLKRAKWIEVDLAVRIRAATMTEKEQLPMSKAQLDFLLPIFPTVMASVRQAI